MKRFKQILFIASALLGGSLFTACSDDNDTPVFPEKEEVTYDMSGFARGADVSWLTDISSILPKKKNRNVCPYCVI